MYGFVHRTRSSSASFVMYMDMWLIRTPVRRAMALRETPGGTAEAISLKTAVSGGLARISEVIR